MRYCPKSVYRCVVNLVVLSIIAAAPLMGSQLPPNPGDALVGLEAGLPPSLLRSGPLGELIMVYTPRNPDELQRLLNLARSDRDSAEKDTAESRRLAAAADGRVRIVNEEVQTTKTRLSVAKKAKNESDSTTLAVELKRQEAEMKYIERVRDTNRADAADLDSQNVAASARVKALELEVDVARKYNEVIAAGAESSPVIAGYQEALKQMLSAQQEAADREADAASKQKILAVRRLKQLDALSKLKR